MRALIYKNIIDLCDSICEAVNYMIDQKNLSLLPDCIISVNAINDNILSNGNDIKSMSLIEAINNITNELKIIQDGTKEDLSRLLELAYTLSDSCRKNIKYTINVVFFAELGGKWDSMDSVYQSLMKREDCHVDVVLAPIFRAVKLKDDSVRTDVVYDDYLTSMGINHIPYTEYIMEEKEPDIAFISQPYESVTPEMFWSENISKYSRLVYLPYFSSTTIKKEISCSFDSFFKLNTERFSWLIPCQSETMQEYYKEYASLNGKNTVVTGIPKWDYPISLNKINTPCPKDWKSKLRGKVFLWNTHFSLSNQGFNIFEEGKKFIDLFLKNDNISLIWRPHPMTESIIKLYAPEKLSIYQNMIATIKNSSNIVIDDSPKYDSAFVWSDALISDFSSLVDQYILMNKPFAYISNLSLEDTYAKYKTSDNLFDFSKVHFINSIEMAEDFINSVVANNDFTKENREYLKNTYFKYADGNAGKRFSDILIRKYKKEVLQIDEGIMENQEGHYEDKLKLKKATVLVLGSMSDSKPCIKQLDEKQIDYYVCDFFDSEDNLKFDKWFSINNLNEYKCDYYVITSRKNCEFLKNLLITEYKINSKKIILFWKMYDAFLPVMVCDRIMKNPLHQNYEGIILGISHAEVGIIASKLKCNFCNLSVSSQDLYFQKKTLQYVIEQYPEKVRELKYAIIDLYDYQYFNFDTSLSKSAIKYLSWGGFNKDPHNFDKNKNFEYSYSQIMSYLENERFKGITQFDINVWESIFDNIYSFNDYKGFDSNFSDITNRLKFVSDKDVDSYEYDSKTCLNIFNDTINENIGNLKQIFELLIGINPQIKIFTVMIPKYIKAEIRHYKYQEKHIAYFNDIIAELRKKYSFTHLNFKKISDISSHKNYYFDAAHLNYFGARVLTEELNKIMFGTNENK